MKRTHSYETSVVIETRPPGCYIAAVTAKVTHKRISISAPALDSSDHSSAERWAKATLMAVERARRVHRRIFGKSAP